MSVQVRDIVKIVRRPDDLSDWNNQWLDVMSDFVGNEIEYEVVDVTTSGVLLDPVDKRRKHLPYAYPEAALQVVGQVRTPVVGVGQYVKVLREYRETHLRHYGPDAVYYVRSVSARYVVVTPVLVADDVSLYTHSSGYWGVSYTVARNIFTAVDEPKDLFPADADHFSNGSLVQVNLGSVSGIVAGLVVENVNNDGMYYRVEIIHAFNREQNPYGTVMVPVSRMTLLRKDPIPRRTESQRRVLRNVYRERLTTATRQQQNVLRSTGELARRYTGVSSSHNDTLRQMGQEVRVAIASNDAQGFSHGLNRLNALGYYNTSNNLLNKYSDRFELSRCSCCESVTPRSTLVRAQNDQYGDSADADVCPTCIGNYYVYSNAMGRYLRRGQVRRYFPTDESYREDRPDYIFDEWARQNLQNTLRHSSIYYCEALVESLGLYDDRLNDNEARAYDGLNSYHATSRDFTERGGTSTHPALGVEIEVYANYRRKAVQALREIYDSRELYLETDGSLHARFGFEVITQPYGKELWKEHSPKILGALLSAGAVGYNHPDRDRKYGIHINVNRDHLSPLQEARIFMFHVASQNRDFVQAIAQRKSIYRAEINIGGIEVYNQHIHRIGGLTSYYDEHGDFTGKRKIQGRGKYCPLKISGNIMEFRIFQSTLMQSSFDKNLEFVWALIEWTSPTTSSGTSWLYTDFLKWLGKRPHAERDYPNLMAYLRKPKYIAKFSDGPINNTWLDLVRPAVRSSIVVSTDEDILLAA